MSRPTSNDQLRFEIEQLWSAHRAAEALIYSLLGNEDDEADQAKKLLAWSNAAAALDPTIREET